MWNVLSLWVLCSCAYQLSHISAELVLINACQSLLWFWARDFIFQSSVMWCAVSDKWLGGDRRACITGNGDPTCVRQGSHDVSLGLVLECRDCRVSQIASGWDGVSRLIGVQQGLKFQIWGRNKDANLLQEIWLLPLLFAWPFYEEGRILFSLVGSSSNSVPFLQPLRWISDRMAPHVWRVAKAFYICF